MYSAYGYVYYSTNLLVYTIEVDLQRNYNYLFHFKL